MPKQAVVVLKPKGKDPVHIILPPGSKVLTVTKMTDRDIDRAEDQGNSFFRLRLQGG